MAPPVSINERQLIFKFSGHNQGIVYIQKKLLDNGFHRSISTISRVINNNGKKQQARINNEDYKYQRSSPVLTKPILRNIKRKYMSNNPPSFRKSSQSLSISKSTIHRAVTSKNILNMDKRKKVKSHYLTESDKQNRKTNARKLYENYLSGSKSKYVVTIDEAWIVMLSGQQQTDHYYIVRNQPRTKKIVQGVKQNFPPKFMIVGAMCESRTFPLFKVPGKVKINSKYYVDYVLKPLITDHLVPYFGENINRVVIHHDKAPSHVSNFTTKFLIDMEKKYGISYIFKDEIPVKGADIAPMDFFGFGTVKQELRQFKGKSEECVWKNCQSIWNGIDANTCANVLRSWKQRCRLVAKEQGGHIEHIHGLHNRLINKQLTN